jgi:hypothetical protein
MKARPGNRAGFSLAARMDGFRHSVRMLRCKNHALVSKRLILFKDI